MRGSPVFPRSEHQQHGRPRAEGTAGTQKLDVVPGKAITDPPDEQAKILAVVGKLREKPGGDPPRSRVSKKL